MREVMVGLMVSTTPNRLLCEYPDVSRISTSRMVGRREELSHMVDVLSETREGRPAVALITGDAGIGKTRLVDELAKVAIPDTQVVVGHCDALGEMVPVSALADLYRQADISDLEAGDAANAVGVALLGGRSESIAPLGLCEGVMGLVNALVSAGPLLMVFEDLHWADASTRNVFGYIARRLTNQPALLVGTYRTDELHRRHPLVPFLSEFERSLSPIRIDLSALDRGELVELAEGIRGETPGRDLIERVALMSGGNPFFAEELLASRSAELPDNLREAVLGRVALLGEADTRLLRLAAAAGSTIDPQIVATVSDLDLEWLQNRLHRMVGSHLVQTERGLAFRHALAREVLYGELLPGERETLHFGYAAAMAEMAPERLGEIAYHLYAAGDDEAAFPAALAAAKDASGRGAMAEALSHVERALAMWTDKMGAPGGTAHAMLVGEAATLAADIRDYERAISLVESELGVPDLETSERVDLSILLAQLRWGADRPDVLEPIEAAMAIVADGSPEKADVLLARSHHLNQAGRTGDALAAGNEALNLATSLGDHPRQQRATLRINTVRAELGDRHALVEIRSLLTQLSPVVIPKRS